VNFGDCLATDTNAVYVFGPDIAQAGGMNVNSLKICRWLVTAGGFPDNVSLSLDSSAPPHGIKWQYCGTNPSGWVIEVCSLPFPSNWRDYGQVDGQQPGDARTGVVQWAGMYVRVDGGSWNGYGYTEPGPYSNVVFVPQ
jgi:hypothetical protein